MIEDLSAKAAERIVALNATGGNDLGAGVVVDGAIAAAKNGVRVALVGDPEGLSGLLYQRGCFTRLVDGSNQGRDAIGKMHFPEMPVIKGSTMKNVAQLVANGVADALVSGGQTDRTVVVGSRRIGLVKNVQMPSIAVDAPRLSGVPQTVLDVGGMPDEGMRAFIDRAFLGQAAARANGIARPRIGLINMGKEIKKGTPAKKLVHKGLEKLASEGLIDFAGNVEGDDIFGLLGDGEDAPDARNVDVVLSDADEGNEMLKLVKKMAKVIKALFRQKVFTGLIGKPAGLILMPRIQDALGPFRSDNMSTSVLGAQKPIVVYHGSSRPGAVEHALYRAVQEPINLSDVPMSIARACEILKLPLDSPKKAREEEDDDQ